MSSSVPDRLTRDSRGFDLRDADSGFNLQGMYGTSRRFSGVPVEGQPRKPRFSLQLGLIASRRTLVRGTYRVAYAINQS